MKQWRGGMILERGNMWSVLAQTDLFLISANSTLKANGALVMGRGLAREARDRFPGLDHEAGMTVLATAPRRCFPQVTYGLIVLPTKPLGLFQVKYHWADPAVHYLIAESIRRLGSLIQAKELARVDLNFPGIGNGRLTKEEVLPIISKLPDSVHVWERA